MTKAAGAEDPAALAEPHIDHILIGARDLDQARKWAAAATGVEPVYGGKHPTGTHNALLSLGGGAYLELIAPQPGSGARGPFGDLSKLATPQPIVFAVAGGSVEALRERLERAGFRTTAPEAGSRTTPAGETLRWQTFRLVDEIDLAPFFIAWSPETPHPSTTAPAGCALRRFALLTPQTEGLYRLRAALGLGVEVHAAPQPALELQLACPKGPLTLRTAPAP